MSHATVYPLAAMLEHIPDEYRGDVRTACIDAVSTGTMMLAPALVRLTEADVDGVLAQLHNFAVSDNAHEERYFNFRNAFLHARQIERTSRRQL
jgi:hypothetical protein